MKHFIVTVPLCLIMFLGSVEAQESRSSTSKKVTPKAKATPTKKPANSSSSKAKPSKASEKAQAAKQKREMEQAQRDEAERLAAEAQKNEEQRQVVLKELEALKIKRGESRELARKNRAQGVEATPEERRRFSADLDREVALRKILDLDPIQKEMDEIGEKIQAAERKVANFKSLQDKAADLANSFASNSGLPGGTRLQPSVSRESRDAQAKRLESLAKQEASQREAIQDLSVKRRSAMNRLVAKKAEIEKEYGVTIPW